MSDEEPQQPPPVRPSELLALIRRMDGLEAAIGEIRVVLAQLCRVMGADNEGPP